MTSTGPKLFDLIIVGAGPAGAAAAIHARRQDASVLLIDREPFPRARPCTGWLSPAAIELAQSLGITQRAARAKPISGLRLHSWNLRSSADVRDAELNAWIVDRAVFDHALAKAAAKARADTRLGVAPEDLDLGEDFVTVRLSDRSVARGKIVLIGDGAFSTTAVAARLPPAGHAADLPQCAFLEFETAGAAASLDVAIGASRAGQIATLTRQGKRARLALMTRERDSSLLQQFQTFREAAVVAGLLPETGLPEPLEGHTPAGVALDMDTHVGKRCLLIGDAGGFVAAFSNEGLYPTMRSGCVAVDAALAALAAPVVQDELATFGAAWRGQLADHLRMPNTDLALLMPLVFKNEQMSRRVARAFLLGQQF